MLPITSLYAGLIALLFLVLSFRVIAYRRANRVSLGDAGDDSLFKRIRAQANCAEYAPIGLILLALVELQDAPGFVVHLLGAALFLGRSAHAYGLSTSPLWMRLRVLGMVATTLMIGSAALGLIAHAVI